jgi:hypothetical protein
MPVFWGSNKPGMQAGDELPADEIEKCKTTWLALRDQATVAAEHLIYLGLHKQIANRILEPWSHINVIVSATDWDNFYELRCHPDAQPEMRALADAMRLAEAQSTPQFLEPGQWHLPYVRESDLPNHPDVLKAISVARCARVSYLTHDGKETTPFEDLKLAERLLGAQPIHASPAEHQATPLENFTGWLQHRKQLEQELKNDSD